MGLVTEPATSVAGPPGQRKKVVSPGDDLHGSLSKRKDGNNKKTYIELKCQNEIKDRDGYANHYKSL